MRFVCANVPVFCFSPQIKDSSILALIRASWPLALIRAWSSSVCDSYHVLHANTTARELYERLDDLMSPVPGIEFSLMLVDMAYSAHDHEDRYGAWPGCTPGQNRASNSKQQIKLLLLKFLIKFL